MAKRIVEVFLAVLLMAGAFHVGQRWERKWWRTEIAQKSSRVQAAMTKLNQDAADFDATLIELIGDADAKLTAAETAVDVHNSSPPPATAPDSECRPIPSHCLRRPRPGGDPANRTAARQQ